MIRAYASSVLVGALATLIVSCTSVDTGSTAEDAVKTSGRHDGQPSSPSASGSPALAEPSLPERLGVEEAIERALRDHPELQAAAASAAGAEALASQAGVYPNPTLDLTAESARISGRTDDGMEYVAGLRQPIPLGGRLSAERHALEAATRAARQRHEATRRKLVAAVRMAFVDALHATRALDVERRRDEIASETVRLTRALREAGDASAEDVARTELDAGRARLRLEAATRRDAASRQRLAARIGSGSLGDVELEGDLGETVGSIDVDALVANLEAHPEVLATRESIDEAEARLDLERARRIPDVEIGGAYRRLRVIDAGDDIDSFDATLSIPLPIFDRRSGAVRAAQAELDEARSRAELAHLTIASRARELATRVREVRERERVLAETVEPAAARVLETVEARRREGDASLFDLLRAREERWRASRELLDARRELGGLAAELEYLAR